jgi:hypothetical protein
MSITTTTTFAQVIDGLPVGARLVRGEDVTGYWTGKIVHVGDGETRSGIVYNQTTKSINYVPVDDESQWRVSKNFDGSADVTNNEVVIDLLEKFGDKCILSQANSQVAKKAENDLRTFRNNVQSTLREYAEQYLDDESAEWDELHDALTGLGLDGLKRTYNVTVRVTYDVEFEVEASSKDAARDIVENDTSSYVTENIDTYYWDDYEITDVNES